MRSFRLSFFAAPAILLVLLTLAQPTRAADPPAAPAKAASDDKTAPDKTAPDKAQIEQAIRLLEDAQARDKLVQQLKALNKAVDVAKGEEERVTVGARVVAEIRSRYAAATELWAQAFDALSSWRGVVEWAQRQAENPASKDRWLNFFIALAEVLVAGYAARALAWWALSQPRNWLERRSPPGALAKLPYLLARTALNALPAVALAVAAYAALAMTDPAERVRLAALPIINASIAIQMLLLAAGLFLSPASPGLRLLPIDDGAAARAMRQVRMIGVVGFYGWFFTESAFVLGLPKAAYALVLKTVGAIVALMIVHRLFTWRRAVARLIRGDKTTTTATAADAAATDAAATDADAAGPAENDGAKNDGAESDGEAQAASPAENARQPNGPQSNGMQSNGMQSNEGRRNRGLPFVVSGGALAAARRRFADVWHLVAAAYVGVACIVWLMEIKGGFTFIARATAITAASLFFAQAIASGVARIASHPVRLSSTAAWTPSLERRLDGYRPWAAQAAYALTWTAALAVAADAWGLGVVNWLSSSVGQRWIGSGLTIAFALILAVAAWEAVSLAIERALLPEGPDGARVERSARVRTLLPLLRNAFLVLLVVFFGLFTLAEIGVNIAPLLAGAGVIGLAVGFGSQTLVKDVITGLFILLEDTISVGDVVDVGGKHSGSVEAISIRTIRLRDASGAVHTIPFSSVTTIRNMTKDFAFAVFDVQVGYSEDPDRVSDVLREIAESMQRDDDFRRDLLAPLEVMGLDRLADSGIVVKARFKTRPMRQWAVSREFNRRMKKRFDELGISIPYPHMQLVVPQALSAPAGGDGKAEI